MKASWRKEHLCGFFNDCCSCCWIMERGREEKSIVDNKEENAAGSRWHATLNASVGCGAWHISMKKPWEGITYAVLTGVRLATQDNWVR